MNSTARQRNIWMPNWRAWHFLVVSIVRKIFVLVCGNLSYPLLKIKPMRIRKWVLFTRFQRDSFEVSHWFLAMYFKPISIPSHRYPEQQLNADRWHTRFTSQSASGIAPCPPLTFPAVLTLSFAWRIPEAHLSPKSCDTGRRLGSASSQARKEASWLGIRVSGKIRLLHRLPQESSQALCLCWVLSTNRTHGHTTESTVR